MRIGGINLAEIDPIFLLLSVPCSTGVHKLFLKGPDGKYFTLAGDIPRRNYSAVLWEWEASTENSDVSDNALFTKPGVGWDSAHGCSLLTLFSYRERVWWLGASSELFGNVP